MECCKIEWKAGYYIEYCPLHKAAPDLLEACKLALHYRYWPDARKTIEAAIRKAEGGDTHET